MNPCKSYGGDTQDAEAPSAAAARLHLAPMLITQSTPWCRAPQPTAEIVLPSVPFFPSSTSKSA